MLKWKSSTLGGIATVITGPFGSQLHKADYVSKGVPVIMPQNIGDRTVDFSNIAYISEDDANRLNRYCVQKNDIVYSRRGDVEKHAFITDFLSGVLCGTGCLRVRFTSDEIYPEFISLYLNRPETRKWIRQHVVGSSMPNLNSSILSDVPLSYPSKEKQISITNVLKNIEHKIQLNNRIISELEAMAKTIYDYWFVQFDFPDANGKPYRSSGGEMVWNEQLKREAPIGWDIEDIDRFVKVIRGVTYGKDDVSDVPKDGYTTLLRSNNISNGTINYKSLVYVKNNCVSDSQLLDEHSIFIAMSSGSKEHVGKTAITPCNLNTSFGAFCSKITITDSAFAWLAIYFRTQYFKSYVKNICLGTNINNLTNEHICSIKLSVPPQSLLDKYNTLMIPLIKKQGNCHGENLELIKLRDWLLPMLMNGQVTIE